MRMNLRSVPAYTMRPKTNQFNKQLETPGVGTYQMDHKDVLDVKNPQHSFPKSTKLDLKEITPNVVGPGKYETNNTT